MVSAMADFRVIILSNIIYNRSFLFIYIIILVIFFLLGLALGLNINSRNIHTTDKAASSTKGLMNNAEPMNNIGQSVKDIADVQIDRPISQTSRSRHRNHSHHSNSHH